MISNNLTKYFQINMIYKILLFLFLFIPTFQKIEANENSLKIIGIIENIPITNYDFEQRKKILAFNGEELDQDIFNKLTNTFVLNSIISGETLVKFLGNFGVKYNQDYVDNITQVYILNKLNITKSQLKINLKNNNISTKSFYKYMNEMLLNHMLQSLLFENFNNAEIKKNFIYSGPITNYITNNSLIKSITPVSIDIYNELNINIESIISKIKMYKINENGKVNMSILVIPETKFEHIREEIIKSSDIGGTIIEIIQKNKGFGETVDDKFSDLQPNYKMAITRYPFIGLLPPIYSNGNYIMIYVHQVTDMKFIKDDLDTYIQLYQEKMLEYEKENILKRFLNNIKKQYMVIIYDTKLLN